MKPVVKLLGLVLKSLVRIESKLDIIINMKIQESGKFSLFPSISDTGQVDPTTSKKVEYRKYQVIGDGYLEEVISREDPREVPITAPVGQL